MGDNLIGHGFIDYAFVYSMMYYAFWAGQTKPHRILYILPACLSCFFFIPVGSNLTADKLVPTVFIISVVLSKGSSYFALQNKNSNNWSGKMWLLIAFSIVIGLIYTDFYVQHVKSPLFSTRMLIQVISYINFMLIFIILRKECSKLNGKNILLKSFIITTSILCLYGLYQHFAHQFGWPYRGIVYSANKTGFGGFSNSKDFIFRVNSLANEPKRLTYFLVIGLLILLKYKKDVLTKINFIIYYFLILLHGIVLWLTYATSIYIILTIFIAFLMIYTFFIKFNKILFRQLSIITLLGLATFIYQKKYIKTLYEVRVGKQIDDEEIRAEVKGQEFILNYPEMFILGLGPGNYNFALSKEYPEEAGLSEQGRILIPFNSALMTYLFDFGLLGLLIIVIPLTQIVFNNKIASRNEFSIFVFFLYCTTLTLNPSATLFFFIGAFEGFKNIEE
tara:strand:- start:2095 stop:3438 length:1344 start_codon:yes stop_codon:yes gene_type:complete